MANIEIGKIMKIDRSEPLINENGREFYLGYENETLVEILSKRSLAFGEIFTCKDKFGHIQNVPSQYLKEATEEELKRFYIKEDENQFEMKYVTPSKLDIVELELAKVNMDLELKQATIKKLKMKQLQKDLEIKLLKKELAKYEN